MPIDSIGSSGIAGYLRTGAAGAAAAAPGVSKAFGGVPGLSNRMAGLGLAGGISGFSATPPGQMSPTLAASRKHMGGLPIGGDGMVNPGGRHHHVSETFEDVTAKLARGDMLGALRSGKNGVEDVFAGVVANIPVVGPFVTGLGGVGKTIADGVIPGGSHLMDTLVGHQEEAFDATTSPFSR